MSANEPGERPADAAGDDAGADATGASTEAAGPEPPRRRFLLRRRPVIFYGWWVVLSGTAIMALMGAFSYYGMGVFFNSIKDDLGWSAAALGAALSLARIQGGVLAPGVGFLIDRYGSQKLVLIGVVLSGLGFILLGQTMSVVYF